MAKHRRAKPKPDLQPLPALLLCLASVGICLAYSHWRSELPSWWKQNGGGIPYVVFWVLFWFMLFPYRRCVLPICVFATSFTCLLEFFQLWQPAWLMQVRATKFGAALLGSGFTWDDFPPYFLGGFFGYVILFFVTQANGSDRTNDNLDDSS